MLTTQNILNFVTNEYPQFRPIIEHGVDIPITLLLFEKDAKKVVEGTIAKDIPLFSIIVDETFTLATLNKVINKKMIQESGTGYADVVTGIKKNIQVKMKERPVKDGYPDDDEEIFKHGYQAALKECIEITEKALETARSLDE